MKFIGCCIIVISMLVSVLCGPLHAREITDMVGQKVLVPDVIRKVYGVSPPATCMLYAIDPDLMAGLNYAPRREEVKYMSDAVQKLPIVGGWFGQGQTPNLETLMQVNPDIVLLWQWQHSASIDKIEKTLAPLGFPVVHIQVNTLDDYPRAFEFLGKLLDREGRSNGLAEYARETLSAIHTLDTKLSDKEKVSVYYAEGADGLSTDCSASLHAELIGLCGGKNVHACEAKDVFGMEKVSAEQVIRYNPGIILARESVFYDRVQGDPRWKSIRAVQEHKVFRIPRSPYDWFDRPPSFMRLLGARWLMNKLHPDLYGVDMVKETQVFYKLFLNRVLDRKEAAEILYP